MVFKNELYPIHFYGRVRGKCDGRLLNWPGIANERPKFLAMEGTLFQSGKKKKNHDIPDGNSKLLACRHVMLLIDQGYYVYKLPEFKSTNNKTITK